MSEHTPGPWSVCKEPLNDMWFADRTIYDVDGLRRIADVHMWSSKANARLIAAAPLLLLCLEDLAEQASDWAMSGTSLDEAVEAARAVIKKATSDV